MPCPRNKEEWEAYKRMREEYNKPFKEDGTPNPKCTISYS